MGVEWGRSSCRGRVGARSRGARKTTAPVSCSAPLGGAPHYRNHFWRSARPRSVMANRAGAASGSPYPVETHPSFQAEACHRTSAKDAPAPHHTFSWFHLCLVPLTDRQFRQIGKLVLIGYLLQLYAHDIYIHWQFRHCTVFLLCLLTSILLLILHDSWYRKQLFVLP